MADFSQKEKLNHYTGVASGQVEPKKGSKFNKKEQLAYARGQRDARNEAKRIYAFKNATPEERKKYKDEQAKRRAEYKKSHS